MSKDIIPEKKSAVSLKYIKGISRAPKVTAKGQGWIADNIIKLAKDKNIPIREDRDLVNLLSEVDVGNEVPESLYKVVAELLAWVYQLNKDFSNSYEIKGK